MKKILNNNETWNKLIKIPQSNIKLKIKFFIIVSSMKPLPIGPCSPKLMVYFYWFMVEYDWENDVHKFIQAW